MRIHYSTKDNITGYELLLSECSYNMAMEWLERDCKKHCIRPYKTDRVGNLIVVYTTDNYLNDSRRFYYDEDRGYLMGE